MVTRKPKRGPLSKMELLPDEAQPFVNDAIQALKERRRTQEDIRSELNNHLLSIGCEPVSVPAFNRKSLQIAAHGQQLLEVREIASIMAEKLNDAPDGDIGLLLNETIKALVYDLIMEQALSDKSVSIDMLRKSSDALMRLEKARVMSIDNQIKLKEKFIDTAKAAISKAATKSGLSKDVIDRMKEEFLGVVKRDKP